MNYAMFENVIFEAVVGNVCFQIIFIFIIQHMRNWKRVFALKKCYFPITLKPSLTFLAPLAREVLLLEHG